MDSHVVKGSSGWRVVYVDVFVFVSSLCFLFCSFVCFRHIVSSILLLSMSVLFFLRFFLSLSLSLFLLEGRRTSSTDAFVWPLRMYAQCMHVPLPGAFRTDTDRVIKLPGD